MASGENGQDDNGDPRISGVNRFAFSEFSDLFKLILMFVFGILPFLAGVILIGFQAWGWLSTGLWQSLSLTDGLKLLSSAAWLAAPTSQYVLHGVIDAIPLSLALVGLSGISFWLSDRLD